MAKEAWQCGMEVVVDDLSITTSFGKRLLQHISCAVSSGDLVALMGPSGAGKTTLLNALAGRSGDSGGRISYGGKAFQQVRSSLGYVTQEDIMYETLTCRENLGFAAAFIWPKLSTEARSELVQGVLEKLNLIKCADTVVGSPGLVRGISGGERKRTNVGLSLLGNPSLLLMDEPTSGLDSKMSDSLMRDVKQIAEQGCTVIATIHQPSEAVFNRFSKVLLLEAGRLAYYGAISGLRSSLAGLGFACPISTPLPELLLDLLEIPGEAESPGDATEHRAKLAKLRQMSDSASGRGAGASGAAEGPVRPVHLRAGWGRQLVVLFQRELVNLRRNKALTLVRAVQSVASSLLIGLIFLQLERNMSSLQPRLFSSFLLVFAQFLFALLGVVNAFPAERAVFLRETQDKLYHPAMFYLAKVSIDTIMQSLFPILVVAISYPLIALNGESAERILWFYAIMAVVSNCGAGLGFMVSAAVPSVTLALSIAPGLVMPQLLLAGIFIKVDDLPQPFKAISYLMVARYAVQATVVNEFSCSVKEECTPEVWRLADASQCGSSPCDFCCTAHERRAAGGICPVLSCDDALVSLGMDEIWPKGASPEETIWHNFAGIERSHAELPPRDHGVSPAVSLPEAVLLHFCVCDFASFWRKRWTQLGYLSASDQFRVRTSSGAMMARFYRLQCQGRQSEARELFATMFLQSSEALAVDLEVKILAQADPTHPAGRPEEEPGARWAQLAIFTQSGALPGAGPASRRAEETLRRLAPVRQSQRGGQWFSRWHLATSGPSGHGSRTGDVRGLRRRESGEAWRRWSRPQVLALEAAGRHQDAAAAAMEGAKLLSGSPIGHVLQELERRLRVATESRPNFTGRILTPTELQEAVLRAIRPEGRQSRLFAALLAVAMGWWHEVNGDEQLFANALGRAAIGAPSARRVRLDQLGGPAVRRRELSALDAAVRPTPLLPVRELWDQGAEEQLKAFQHAVHDTVHDTVVLADDAFGQAWLKFAGLGAEINGPSHSPASMLTPAQLQLHPARFLAGGDVLEPRQLEKPPAAPARSARRRSAAGLQGVCLAASAASLALARCGRKKVRPLPSQLRATSDLQILPATSSDLSAAASVAVRALRWTRGWLDTPTFTDDDYALLSSREAPVYQSIYLNDTGYPSTMLVARLRETDPPKKESNWWSEWFDLGGSGSSSKVVGCVGCEVKCFNRLSNQQLPNTQYDGCQQTVLRPVMADLAVAEECRGRGVARKLVEQLEEVVRTWGYDELVLLVEASNFQARGVYGRLGYRLAGLRPAEATFFLDKSGGGRQVAERKTVALILRKSLKPFPQGALENFDWLTLFIALGLGSLILGQTELGDVGDLWPKLLALMNSAV
ncbi:Protein white [Durusdinium trenchii]|uniref:Protein white n=1 Tax=Durusdinium trenchii TaxID=1381693 RepID=A0ABP0KHD7_9DINO